MARMNKNSLRLDADFTEDTVGFALESFLALLSFPRFNFSIEPFSRGRERWLGADARLNGRLKSFKPFYMQFKRPSAYPDMSGSSIIRDRKRLNLSVSPRTLYFDLRAKQTSHWDYQHNILYRLRRRLMAANLGDACYICPLFLDREAYRFNIHMAGLRRWPRSWRSHPWDLEDVLVNASDKSVNFNAIPVLKEHISIPPHTQVDHARHRYSFTESGTELCFHSPEALPEGCDSLAEFLRRVTGDVRSDENFIPVENAQKIFFEMYSQPDNRNDQPLIPEDFPRDEDGIRTWLHWGDYLKKVHQIEQFALMHWEK